MECFSPNRGLILSQIISKLGRRSSAAGLFYYPQNMVSILGPRVHMFPSPTNKWEGKSQGNTYPVLLRGLPRSLEILYNLLMVNSYLVAELVGSEVYVTQKP